MLKLIELFDKPAFVIKNNNKLLFESNNGNNKSVGFSHNTKGLHKKLKKLKGLKLSKSWKLSKSGIKLFKSGNLPKFSAKKVRPNFLTFETKKIFNRL